MVVGDAHASWLSHTGANITFFPKPPDMPRKYARKKVCFNLVSNSHPPDTLNTESLRRASENTAIWKSWLLPLVLKTKKIKFKNCQQYCHSFFYILSRKLKIPYERRTCFFTRLLLYRPHLTLYSLTQLEQDRVCKTPMPCNGHFFKNCDLDIWPWP